MKIACLQFAPQVGDVDNNLNRADAVLNKARTGDLDDLDLLVLPELAFTGTFIADYLLGAGGGGGGRRMLMGKSRLQLQVATTHLSLFGTS